MPISLRARSSGATLTMHDIAFGVPLEKVTFNPADYLSLKRSRFKAEQSLTIWHKGEI